MRETQDVILDDIVTAEVTNSRFVSETTYTPDSDGNIVLEEIPRQIDLVTFESETEGNDWWENSFSQLYTSPFDTPEEEARGSTTITLDGSAIGMEDVKVSYMPRNLYTASLKRASISNNRRLISQTIRTDVSSNVPLDQRLTFKGNETLVTYESEDTDGYTDWRFFRASDPVAAFQVRTTDSGVESTYGIGNIESATATKINVILDRSTDWYVQFRINDGPWGAKQLLDVTPRRVTGKHRDNTTVTATSSGATVRTSNPKFTSQKTSRGIKIVNKTYPEDT